MRSGKKPTPRSVAPIFIAGLFMLTPSLMGQELYDFGNPTGDEQLYIELINRARANPSAEGARFATTTDPVILNAYSQFGVDLTIMQEEFTALAVQPPLAPNASLTTAARGHSAWMLANATQSHDQTNPSNTTVSRVLDAGYDYSSVGENVYAYYNLVFQGHAGFQVDWGADIGGMTGGMQSNRGHRANTHSGTYREIGVGVVSGSNGDVGPNLVTQDFGLRAAATSFGTGVAYYDLNGNNFYDSGEGISGLRVDVEGSSNYCTTAIGGGWVVPVPSLATTRAVTFSGLGVNQVTNLAFLESNNAKLDLKLAYTPPAITSSASATEGVSHLIEFEETPGASGYQWSRWSMAAASTENCETTNDITSDTSVGYSVLNTDVKQQGSASFHLVNATAEEQSLELDNLYYGKPTSSLTFQSQIRFATTSETFKVQVKEESDTSDWQDVYSQIGTGAAGEGSFQTRIVDLTSMNGKTFRVRFYIDPGDLSHFISNGNTFGWFIDAISFSNVDALSNESSELLAGTSGSFTPSAGTLLMAVAPRISNIEFPASYQILTTTAQQLQVEQPENTVLTDGATTLTFGSSEVGLPVIKTVTIRNTNLDELTGIAVNLSGTHTSDFVVSAPGDTTLAPEETTTFTVTFTPTALGTRSAALEITSNETAGTPFNLSLSGEGDIDDPIAFTFVGTPYELRVSNTVSFDLKRLISSGETIKLSGKLPSGLKYNSTTGLLSGKLGKPGVYQTSVQVLQGKTVVRTIAFPITVLEFPTSLIGNFDCILEDVDSIPTGAFRLSIKAANQWTATLDAVGALKTRKAKGTFVLGEGTPTAPITAIFPADSGAPAVTINITLDGSTANQTGTYGGGTLRGFRVARAAEYPPATVICNLVLDAGAQDGLTVPAGLGWMKGKVSNKGIGSFKGLLGDGTAASITLQVSACGQAVLWSQPYSNKNSFIGGIVTLGDLDQPATSDLPLSDGALWVKAADANTLSYPNGFPIMPVDIGASRWTVPATATALGASLGWNENFKTAVTIDGGGLSNQEPQVTIAALPTEFSIDDIFSLITSSPEIEPVVAWKGNVLKADGGIVGTLTIPTDFSLDIPAGAAAVSGVLVQDESWGTVTGCGLVKVPTSGIKGSFKTAALILEQ